MVGNFSSIFEIFFVLNLAYATSDDFRNFLKKTIKDKLFRYTPEEDRTIQNRVGMTLVELESYRGKQDYFDRTREDREFLKEFERKNQRWEDKDPEKLLDGTRSIFFYSGLFCFAALVIGGFQSTTTNVNKQSINEVVIEQEAKVDTLLQARTLSEAALDSHIVNNCEAVIETQAKVDTLLQTSTSSGAALDSPIVNDEALIEIHKSLTWLTVLAAFILLIGLIVFLKTFTSKYSYRPRSIYLALIFLALIALAFVTCSFQPASCPADAWVDDRTSGLLMLELSLFIFVAMYGFFIYFLRMSWCYLIVPPFRNRLITKAKEAVERIQQNMESEINEELEEAANV